MRFILYVLELLGVTIPRNLNPYSVESERAYICFEDLPDWARREVVIYRGLRINRTVQKNDSSLSIQNNKIFFNGKYVLFEGEEYVDWDSEVPFDSLPAWAQSKINQFIEGGGVSQYSSGNNVVSFDGKNIIFNGKLVVIPDSNIEN